MAQHQGDLAAKGIRLSQDFRGDAHVDNVLERAARRRAVLGSPEYLTSSGGIRRDPTTGSPIVVRKYSDALLAMLVKANRGRSGASNEGPSVFNGLADIVDDPDPPRTARGRGP